MEMTAPNRNDFRVRRVITGLRVEFARLGRVFGLLEMFEQ
jgi:hypothetical protein